MEHWGKWEAGKNIPLRWCTPPPLDKYSTEVVYPPLWINIPPRWCTPPPHVDKYSTELLCTPLLHKYSTKVVYPPSG